jgi:hypothetical protein
MIRTWANSATRRFAEEGKSKFAGLDEDWAHELLPRSTPPAGFRISVRCDLLGCIS